MCYCLKCEYNVSDLMNWDTLIDEFIECSNCGHKMTVEYDMYYSEEEGEIEYWYLLNYIAD